MASAFASHAELRWGPTAGLNVSSFSWKQDLIATSYTPGLNLGLMTEVMVPGIGFGIDAAIRYSGHGARLNFDGFQVWAPLQKETYMLHSLQIPVNLRFKWTRMNGAERIAAPFAYAGPLFNFNVASSDLPALEHPLGSVGLQCGIGGEFFERYQLSVGYLWGITYDVRTVKLDNYSGQNRGWMINTAILF